MALAARRRLLASIEARTGARLGDASLEAALTRFSARVRAVGGRVDAAKAESIFEDAAARIERLAGQEEGA